MRSKLSWRLLARKRVLLLMTLAVLPALGCLNSTGYILTQARGQLDLLWRARPVSEALASGQLDAETDRKLRMLMAARTYGADVLGLRVGDSWTSYVQLDRDALSYNLSAAPKDQLKPYAFWFPVVGRIDYIGYFAREDMEAARRQFEQDGYDTYAYVVDTYSTLGWFPDPIYSTFLRRGDASLIETMFHELAHNTVYANGHSDFNESLATWVGREAARLYFAELGEDGARMAEALRRQREDGERIRAWIGGLADQLEAFYAGPMSSTEKVAGRGAIFEEARERFIAEVQPTLHEPQRHAGWTQLQPNNALVLLNRRYNRSLDTFDRVYERIGRDFGAMLGKLAEAAASSDPWGRLQSMAAGD